MAGEKPEPGDVEDDDLRKAKRAIHFHRVRTFDQCKAALKAAFGSNEAALIALRRVPLPQGIEELQGEERPGAVIQELMNGLTAPLADVERWKKLAATNRKAYSAKLDQLLTSIKLLLDHACGIESHRPRKDEKRDALILAIKLEKPHRSFGQVAKEYRRQTGQQLSAKAVERIYKRSSEREVERELHNLISLHRPDFRLAEILKLWRDYLRKEQSKRGRPGRRAR
jgi:hypothetical protein